MLVKLVSLINKYIIFYINILNGSKNKLKGKCNKCGKCCKSIIFRLSDNKWINDPVDFELLKSTNNRYNNFLIEGEDEQGRLLFRCKYLDDNNLCKIHFFRSFYCRLYPFTKSGIFTKTVFPPEDCGYYFEVDKPFNKYLNR